jgi:phosphoserine phosphatase
MALVATLVANPSNPVLTQALGEAAFTAVDGAGLYWLADGVACDIALKNDVSADSALARIRDVIGDQPPVDAALCSLPEDGRRKKPPDRGHGFSTMIRQECIDELAEEVGLKDKDLGHHRERAMNGEIAFEPALRERVALLKGLPVDVIAKVIDSRITLTPGGRELVSTMRANRAYTALVSGGFTAFTSVVGGMIGFDENRANVLESENGVLSGTVREPILGKQAKVDALEEIAARLNLDPSDAIAVGDGANDLGMLERAGSGVALHAKPSVAAQADIRIDHGDLTALLYLQGYRRADFVTS